MVNPDWNVSRRPGSAHWDDPPVARDHESKFHDTLAAQQKKEAAEAAKEYYAYKQRVKMYHRELGWDSTSRKDVPPQLRGIRPQTDEPWREDAVNYDPTFGTLFSAPTNKGLAAERARSGAARPNYDEEFLRSRLGSAQNSARRPDFASAFAPNSARADYDDEDAPTPSPTHFGIQVDPLGLPSARGAAGGGASRPITPGRARKKFAERSAASPTASFRSSSGQRNAGGWDSSPFRPTPHSLRGVKPVTPEPWAYDREVVPIYRSEAALGVEDYEPQHTARCSMSSDGATTARTDLGSARGPSSARRSDMGSARGPSSARRSDMGSARGPSSARRSDLGSARGPNSARFGPSIAEVPKAASQKPAWNGVLGASMSALERWQASLSK